MVAAAVILPAGWAPAGLDDSKKLSAPLRERLSGEIRARAAFGIGLAEVAEIDAIGVGRATHRAMVRAVAALPMPPASALVDGTLWPEGLDLPGRTVKGGDGISASIAAASVLAKTHRDAIMVALSQQFPGYAWQSNKGYGVPDHAAALKRLGVTPHHRRSFRPIHKILVEQSPISP